MTTEIIWKDIPEYEGFYQASNIGGMIRSVTRKVPTTCGPHHRGLHFHTRIGKVLKPGSSHHGYLMVCLYRNGKSYCKKVHILIALTFIGRCPDGLVVCHKDENKINNDSSNLMYGSRAKNCNDYFDSVRDKFNKISIEEIPKIIKRIENGDYIKRIALEYKLTPRDIATLNRVIAV